MSFTCADASLPVFVKMLQNARSWLQKAEAHAQAKGYDVSVLLQDRLAADMFTFTRQLQIATDHAKGASARLAGVDVPRYEDNETTVEALRARLDKTIAFILSVDAAAVNANAGKPIAFMGGRQERKFDSGALYLTTYALPNFYFHVTTAYAILRHNGVDVGKADFLNGGA